MKLSLKVYPRWKENQIAIIEELSFHTSKLYNIANHRCTEEYLPYKKLDKELKVIGTVNIFTHIQGNSA